SDLLGLQVSTRRTRGGPVRSRANGRRRNCSGGLWHCGAHPEGGGGTRPRTGAAGRVAAAHHAVSVPNGGDPRAVPRSGDLWRGGAEHGTDGGRRPAGRRRTPPGGVLRTLRRFRAVGRGN